MINETLSEAVPLSAESTFSPGDVSISVRFATALAGAGARVDLERKPSPAQPAEVDAWSAVVSFDRESLKDYILSVVDGAALYRFRLLYSTSADSVQVTATP